MCRFVRYKVQKLEKRADKRFKKERIVRYMFAVDGGDTAVPRESGQATEGTLSKTASPWYNILFIGVLLIGFGLALAYAFQIRFKDGQGKTERRPFP